MPADTHLALALTRKIAAKSSSLLDTFIEMGERGVRNLRLETDDMG